VAGLKNCEEVRACSIPLVISPEKNQLNVVLKQALKTFDVDVAHTQFLEKIIIGGREIFCQLTIIQHR
jgi:hypothetical protein